MSVKLLQLAAGSLFGNDRTTANPRRDLKQLLPRLTPKQRGEILELVQKLGAVELAATIQRQSSWTA